MRQRIAGLAVAAVALVGCTHAKSSASSSIAESLPSPSAVQITPPGRNLVPQIAAFSGVWQGRWIGPGGPTYGTLPARLIVEKISAKSAQVVYIYGAQPGRFQAGWRRSQATVLPFGHIQFGGNERPLLT